jgi:hypothetical protein
MPFVEDVQHLQVAGQTGSCAHCNVGECTVYCNGLTKIDILSARGGGGVREGRGLGFVL